MSSIETLLDEYPGDEAWVNFAAVFKPDFADDRPILLRALIPDDPELADTVVGIFGEDEANAWINRPIGVLDGQSPAHILSTHPDGCRIVRHALMRMPV